jgi:hypothetical protein
VNGDLLAGVAIGLVLGAIVMAIALGALINRNIKL